MGLNEKNRSGATDDEKLSAGYLDEQRIRVSLEEEVFISTPPPKGMKKVWPFAEATDLDELHKLAIPVVNKKLHNPTGNIMKVLTAVGLRRIVVDAKASTSASAGSSSAPKPKQVLTYEFTS